MCGILAIFGIKGDPVVIRKLAVRLSRRQKHRGPDESGIYFNVKIKKKFKIKKQKNQKNSR
jgi:asparagine synthetase B (glutamine-hydrolysing)